MNFHSKPGRLQMGLRWAPALVIAIIIFCFSSMPGDEIDQTYNKFDTFAQPKVAATVAAMPSATQSVNTIITATNTNPRVATSAINKTATATAKIMSTAIPVTSTKSAAILSPRPTGSPTALRVTRMVRNIPIFSTVDPLKASHAIVFFLLGASVLLGLGLRSRWSPAMAVALCALYAVSDEIHQIFVPGRTSSIRDVVIDTTSALAGVAVFFILAKTRKIILKILKPVG